MTVFLVKSKLSTAKKYITTTFSRVFHPEKNYHFLGKSKLNIWTKNEDFEQCVIPYQPKNYFETFLWSGPYFWNGAHPTDFMLFSIFKPKNVGLLSRLGPI